MRINSLRHMGLRVEAFVRGEAVAVCEGEHWRLFGRDGQWRARPEWTSLDWSPERDAFLAERDGKVGLVDVTGRVVVVPRESAATTRR